MASAQPPRQTPKTTRRVDIHERCEENWGQLHDPRSCRVVFDTLKGGRLEKYCAEGFFSVRTELMRQRETYSMIEFMC